MREEQKAERLREKELKKQEKEDLKQQKAAFEEEKKNLEREKKMRRQMEKEDEKNAKLALKATKTIEKAEQRGKDETERPKGRTALCVLLGILCLVSGFGAAALASWIGGVEFYMSDILPFIALVDAFAAFTVCFFLSRGKREVVFGVLSFLTLACGIADLAWLFHGV